jgi:hypothetical protein
MSGSKLRKEAAKLENWVRTDSDTYEYNPPLHMQLHPYHTKKKVTVIRCTCGLWLIGVGNEIRNVHAGSPGKAMEIASFDIFPNLPEDEVLNPEEFVDLLLSLMKR